jgi:hypothetical protein
MSDNTLGRDGRSHQATQDRSVSENGEGDLRRDVGPAGPLGTGLGPGREKLAGRRNPALKSLKTTPPVLSTIISIPDRR